MHTPDAWSDARSIARRPPPDAWSAARSIARCPESDHCLTAKRGSAYKKRRREAFGRALRRCPGECLRSRTCMRNGRQSDQAIRGKQKTSSIAEGLAGFASGLAGFTSTFFVRLSGFRWPETRRNAETRLRSGYAGRMTISCIRLLSSAQLPSLQFSIVATAWTTTPL